MVVAIVAMAVGVSLLVGNIIILPLIEVAIDTIATFIISFDTKENSSRFMSSLVMRKFMFVLTFASSAESFFPKSNLKLPPGWDGNHVCVELCSQNLISTQVSSFS